MNKNRKILLASLMAVFVLAGAVFSYKLFHAADKEKKVPVKIAVSTWPGWSHAFLAQEKGLFKKNNVDVTLIHIKEHVDAQVPFLNGDVDGVFQCFTDTIMQSMQLDSKVVYLSDYSSAGDVIVGNVSRLSDLRGKTISIEGLNTFSHIFVLNALKNAGVNEFDVRFKDIAAHEVLNALEQGLIDAGHTWEPTKSEAIKKGYKILATAGDSPGIISDLLVFRAQIVEKRPGEIASIVKALFEAQEYRDTHREESIKIMAEAVNISYEEMETGLQGTRQLDQKGNLRAMEKSDDPLSLYGSYKFITGFYLNRGQLPSAPNFDMLIEPRFVERLAVSH